MVNELKEKVRKLEKELSTANNHIQFLSDVTGTEVPSEKIGGDGKCEFCGKLFPEGTQIYSSRNKIFLTKHLKQQFDLNKANIFLET